MRRLVVTDGYQGNPTDEHVPHRFLMPLLKPLSSNQYHSSDTDAINILLSDI